MNFYLKKCVQNLKLHWKKSTMHFDLFASEKPQKVSNFYETITWFGLCPLVEHQLGTTNPLCKYENTYSKSLEYLIFGGILCLVLPEKSNLPKIAKDRSATGPNRSIGILGKGHNQSWDLLWPFLALKTTWNLRNFRRRLNTQYLANISTVRFSSVV